MKSALNRYSKKKYDMLKMSPKELLNLIAEGESSVMEFKRKSTSPQKLAKEIAAFANTRGGYLLIGIDDDGTVVGVESEKYEFDVVDTACKFWIEPPVEPEIEFIRLYSREVVVVRINQSENKPHKLVVENGEEGNTYKAYIRLGEKSVEASREMTRLMTYQSDDKPLKLSIGDKEKRLFDYLEKHEKATVKDFARIVNISERRASRLLIRLVRAGVIQIHNDSSHDYFTLR